MENKVNIVFKKIISNIDDYVDFLNSNDIPLSLRIFIRKCEIANMEHYEDKRQYMHTGHIVDPNGEKVYICYADKTNDLSVNNIFGLIMHEIGHIVEEILRKKKMHTNILKVTDDHEIIADMIAEKIFKQRIYYDSMKIQKVIVE